MSGAVIVGSRAVACNCDSMEGARIRTFDLPDFFL